MGRTRGAGRGGSSGTASSGLGGAEGERTGMASARRLGIPGRAVAMSGDHGDSAEGRTARMEVRMMWCTMRSCADSVGDRSGWNGRKRNWLPLSAGWRANSMAILMSGSIGFTSFARGF